MWGLLGRALLWATKWSAIGGAAYTGKDYLTGNMPQNQSTAQTFGGNVTSFWGDSIDFFKGLFGGNPEPSSQAPAPGGPGAPGSMYANGQGSPPSQSNVGGPSYSSGPQNNSGLQTVNGISNFFNNFSNTKAGQALAPVFGFLQQNRLISTILAFFLGMTALSGQNSMGMRLLAGALAFGVVSKTGLLDNVVGQGSGANAPTIGGPGVNYVQSNQLHNGGPTQNQDPGFDVTYEDEEPDAHRSANQALALTPRLG